MKFSWFLFSFLLIISCSSSDDGTEETNPTNGSTISYDWIVPPAKVLGNFSPFPLAENPNLFLASDIDFISDATKVILVKFEDEIRAYPANYMHSFEAVNDFYKNNNYAITYCPITESIIGFNTNYDSKIFTIRASGYLYKENQVLHDNATDTFWSQMELRCIKGIYQDQNYNTFNLIETSWKTVKTYFPNARVFTNASVNKSTKNKTSKSRPGNNDPIYGIVEFGGKEKTVNAFSLTLFNDEIKLFNEVINGEDVIVIGNENLRFITSYINNENAEFTPIQGEFPIIMEDTNGNKWNVFGIAISGPRTGQHLNSPIGFFASWWAWEDFYTNINVKE